MPRVPLLLSLVALARGAGGEAQVVQEPPPPVVEEAADASDLRGRARAAQGNFERRRVRLLPLAAGSYLGACDEQVGRFCTWYEEGDWHPEPEDPRIQELRDGLVATLDAVAREIPGDDWVLGQRVWYRGEGGAWDDAVAVARACGEASPWWCAALEGFALHGLQRYEDALVAFRRSMALMGRDQSRRWRVPEWPVDGEAKDYLEELPEDSLAPALERLWVVADPLYLIPGNDRRTAHYARWTLSRIREDARNPFQISWSGDLDQLTVRHGWEIGWEREWSRNVFDRERVVGHKHPEGRDFMPSGRVLKDPSAAEAAALQADRSRPRSLYAPPYAPVLLPAEGQVAVFPRGDRMAVVASHFLPEDTTFDGGHEHPRPWLDAGDQADRDDEAGLFLVPVAGGPASARRVRGRTEGALLVTAPAGRYVLSAESWSPRLRRAGRHRVGLARDTVPPDLPMLSDVLLLEGGGPEPASLEAALPRVLIHPRIAEGEPLGIVFEVSGLRRAPESLVFELTVERADRSVFRRAGEFLRLVGRSSSLSLQWEEQSPGTLEPLFRWLSLDLPDADPGEYELALTLSMAGRSGVTAARRFTVEAAPR